MKAKLIVTSLLVAGLASPAFAASFYVVQSDGTVYASKKEATDAMTTLEACKAT
jgi:hypothetical protein